MTAAVARTGEALESARAFAATAAHELRTPLTSMGTNLTVLGHPELDSTGGIYEIHPPGTHLIRAPMCRPPW
ncbi:hypothetical protein GCM10022226_32330 [Sphaerisporangium flaviroseum]|uniref:histidine kinase n=1 Tax=Sphaerisporangium flaviroseum TaxID=509199 RepID=A0ABP7I587_9ACTN